MAGIYFPGMEMPRACVWREDGHLRNCPLYDIDGYCGVMHSEACHKEEEHHPDCPAFFVPDHGRLGDLEQLYEVLDGGYDVDMDALPETKAALLEMIASSETIIPSDRKEGET